MKTNELSDKLILIFLALLILLNGGLWAYVKIAEVYNPQESNLFYRSPDHPQLIPPPTGFSQDNRKVSAIPDTNNGWAVRYASPNCHFCRDDQTRWSKLATQLSSKGYQIITIVPNSGEPYSANELIPQSSLQEVYVDLGWLKNIRLSATPTLLIFDSRHGLIWSHKGTLSIADPIDALHQIAYWGKR